MANRSVGLAAVPAVVPFCGASARSSTGSGLKGTDDRTFHSRGPTGGLCLSTKAGTRPNTVLANTYQHLVTLEDTCSKAVPVRVCYEGSNDCKQVFVRPYRDETVLLGGRTGVPTFDFDCIEKVPL